MAKIGRPSTWESRIPEIVQMYDEEKMSRGEIARALGTSVQTISRMLQKAGAHLEDRNRKGPRGPLSEEHKAAVSEGRKGKGTGPRAEWKKQSRFCEWDGIEFLPQKPEQRFCTTACRNAAGAQREKDQAIAEWDASPASWCACGVGRIPYEARHSRRYCSDDCRSNLAPKRQADPANYVTLTCDTCGKDFQRYKGLYKGEGSMTFCNNECAAKWTRKVKHLGFRDTDVVVDSIYEGFLYCYCKLHKIAITRVDRTEAVPHLDGWYAPDFVINGEYVEVKGYEDDDDRARYQAWTDAHPDMPLVIMRREDLIRLAPRYTAETINSR